MKGIKYAKLALVLALPLTAGYANADHSAGIFGMPSSSVNGIVAPSFPNFVDTNEVVTVKKFGSGAANTYWQIAGTGSTAIFDSLNGKKFHSYNLGNENISYTANFDANGRLITSIGGTSLSNTLTITGSLRAGNFGNTSWDVQPNELLLSANLTDIHPGNGKADRLGTYGPFAIGFNTEFTGGWVTTIPGLTGGSTGESLWLAGFSSEFSNLVKALDGRRGNGTLASLFGSTKVIKGVFSVASVPLPGAVWLFGTGLIALLARRKTVAASNLLHNI
jgi:hypothetical protein